MNSNSDAKIPLVDVRKAKTRLMWAGVLFVWFLVVLLGTTLVVILFVRGDPGRQNDLLQLVEMFFGWDVITGGVAVGFGAKFHDAIRTRLSGGAGSRDTGGSEETE